MKKHLLAMLMVAMGLTLGLAQRTVTGKVTDAGGEALIGASVLAKGSTSGTVTSIDGTYRLEVPAGATILVYSYTGFSSQEISLGTSNVVDVALEEGILLEEAIVTALGIQKQPREVGFSVTQIRNEDLTQARVTKL